jgi:hypothetical protein
MAGDAERWAVLDRQRNERAMTGTRLWSLMMSHRKTCLALVVLLPLLGGSPAPAGGGPSAGRDDEQDRERRRDDASHPGRPSGPQLNALYEVTENVNFAPSAGGLAFRNATSALLGVLALDSPLCLSHALLANPLARSCTVLATGSDELSLATGIGPVSGQYWVVVNAPGNSEVHVPDCPVSSGTFSGTIDLSPSVLHNTPLGSVAGTFVPEFTYVACTVPTPLGSVPSVPFTGTFRLPFDVDREGKAKEPERSERAFYLGDRGQLIPVRPDERDLGFPLVRLELHF